jgi:iron complex transport system ATP-binding protein
MSQETIQIKNLDIGYTTKHGVKTVAKGINGTLHSGELTCLLGANGVGKSTLLRTLSAFQPKISGEVFINKKEISSFTDKELSKMIGVVLTEKPDIRNMTVRELVALGRSPYTGFWGTCSKEDLSIVDESIDMVGISPLARRPVHTLSDGERQKAMIAKALAQQTPVIFLDEPTAFLDYPSKVEVLLLLRRICQQAGKTILLSTHDVELALQLADIIWLMEKQETGNKSPIAIGSPQALAEDGSLGRFIESQQNIVFDKETLTIRVQRLQSRS